MTVPKRYKSRFQTIARVCIALAICTPWIVYGAVFNTPAAGATCAGFVFLAALTIITPWRAKP